MNRHTKIIIGIVLLVIVAILIYVFFFSAKPAPGTATGTLPGTFPSTGGVGGEGEGQQGENPFSTGVFEDTIDASAHPTEAAPRLVKITDGPVALGVIALSLGSQKTGTNTSTSTPTSLDTAVRYIERASGNAYEYRASSRTITRLTNRTIPGTIESSWLSDGSYAFLRYISAGNGSSNRHMETYALSMSGQGKMLAEDLSQATGNDSSVVTVSSDKNGSLVMRSGPQGENPVTLLSTTIERLFLFPTKSGLFVQTPASAKADSFIFVADKNGELTRIPAGTKGLAALPSPDGKTVLVSYVQGSSIQMQSVDVATGARTNLPLATLVEKCVWTSTSRSVYCGVPISSPNATYPDDWYQGVVGFQDRLWEINFDSHLNIRIADLPQLAPHTVIDAVGLAVDPADKLLIFMNRNDGSLWAYSL
jgi:hypothetical protein